MRHRVTFAFLLILVTAGLFMAPCRLQAAGQLTRASIASDGQQADRDSFEPALNASGRFLVFSSTGSLVSGWQTRNRDIFLRDRLFNRTTVINQAPGGMPAVGGRSEHPSISADGRFIVYNSYAPNLVPGDTNNAADIFLYDREKDRTLRISVANGGKQANGDSLQPTISENGRYVVYTSKASDLVPGDTNKAWDTFVYDRMRQTTGRVSVSTKNVQGNRDSGFLGTDIDESGHFIVFASDATNLVSGDTNGTADIFIRDLRKDTGVTRRVSISSTGEQANGQSLFPTISGLGQMIGYTSIASNLVPNDTNSTTDIFLFDLSSTRTERVSVSTEGTQADEFSDVCDIDRSGRYIVFSSRASNLAPGDTLKHADIFLRDRKEKVTTRINVAEDGTGADGDSSDAYSVSISDDGRFSAFVSASANLVAGDTNARADVFVYDRIPELGEPAEWRPAQGAAGPPTQAEIAAARAAGTQTVVMKTSRGDITIELYGDKAPVTVANFVKLTRAHFYDGLTFHRVEKDPEFSLIQGGDPDGNGAGGPGYGIGLEIAPELKHVTGALGMARSQDPDSAGSQFYITLCPIHPLDGQYAVFGKVTVGLDVAKKIRVGDKITAIVMK